MTHPGHEADNAYRTAVSNAIERLHECSRSTDLKDVVHTAPVREPQYFLVPVRRSLVVDDMCRAELLYDLELRVRGRRRDDSGTGGDGELKPKDGDTPGALDEDGIAALELVRGPEERVVRCERRARKRRGFLVVEMFRNSHERL